MTIAIATSAELAEMIEHLEGSIKGESRVDAISDEETMLSIEKYAHERGIRVAVNTTDFTGTLPADWESRAIDYIKYYRDASQEWGHGDA